MTGAGAAGVFRVKPFEDALARIFTPQILATVSVSQDGLAGDLHGSAEYRADLISVLAQRAVAEIVDTRRA